MNSEVNGHSTERLRAQYVPPNHRILPTAASFGWTPIAAAADPERSAEFLDTYEHAFY